MSTQKKKDNAKKGDSFINYSKLIKGLWLLFLLGLVSVSGLFVIVSFTKMPDTEELENPNYEYASIIYTDGDEILGKYFSKNREGLSYNDLNPYLIKALIATEDERFHKHSGIDVKATGRAIVYMGSKGGASTITQQLAKLFLPRPLDHL